MENDGKSPVEESEQTLGFGALSESDVVGSLFEEAAPAKTEDEIKNDQNQKNQEINEIIIPGEEAKGNEGDNKGDDKGDGKGTNGDEGDDLLKDKSTNDSSEDNWLKVAKELELDVKEDSFDAFKSAYSNKLLALKEEVKTELQVQKKDDLLSTYDVEAQIIIKGLDAGLSLEQIQKPLEKIDNFLKMNDADLVAEDYRLQGWEEDKIEAKILDLTEAGKLELTAYEIKQELKTARTEISDKRLQDIEALKTQQEERVKTQLSKETEQIHEQLKTVQQFMESPIKEKHVAHVMDKWKKGEYLEAFKDPVMISKFLLWNEFGEQAQKVLANKKFQEGRDGIVKKLHNVPPMQQGAGAPAASKNESPIGNFSILEGVKDDQL